MDCAEHQSRLVALDDGELGRSEQQLTLSHLASCGTCRDRRAVLTRVTPRPHRSPPIGIRERLDAMDLDTILAQAPPRPVQPARFPQLGRRFEVPLVAILAYVFAFAAVTAWGVSTWWQSGEAPTQIAQQTEEHPETFPPQAWQPASYTPSPAGIPDPARAAPHPEGPVYH